MIISHSKRFIFIHNYKVAGRSIKTALQKYNYSCREDLTFLQKLKESLGFTPPIFSYSFKQHLSAKELRESIPEKIFSKYYKFGFVRNPYDWQVSLYHYMLKDENHYQHHIAKEFASFDQYLEWRIKEDIHLQREFFYDGDDMIMDYIGKMENLNEDFKRIAAKIKITGLDLPVTNASQHKHFETYYTQGTADLVFEAFSPDFKAFDYQRLKV